MSLKTRFQNLLGIETKSGTAAPDTWMFDLFGATPTASSVRVTPKSAMTCAPVRCAVQAISEAIGQLPIHVYQRGADGSKQRAPDHPVHRLLHDEVNDWTPAAKFKEEITRDALLYPQGGFAFINRVDGKPVELIRYDQEFSKITVTSDENGEPIYKVKTGRGEAITVARENILHIPSPSLNGEGLIYEAREAIGLAITMERHASHLFANGARPSGVITVPARTPAEDIALIAEAWKLANGGSQSGGTAILPNDSKWNPISLTSTDSQFLELRTFAIQEIARFFRVPPHMLMELDRTIQANAEQLGQEFLTYCLMSWTSRWIGEIRLKLFTPEERATYFAEFLTDDFVKANLAVRMEAYSKAIAARILNPNEARAAENRAPYSGGDKFENPNTTTTTTARAA